METNDMVEWKKLGEICVSLKKEIIKQDNLVTNGKYPVVNSGVTLYGRYNEYNNIGNAFTFASRGEYAGFLTYMSEEFWAGGLCYPYRSADEERCLTKFIYEYLKSQELYVMDRLVARGGIPALNKADVEKIQIPIPSLAEQTRIVGILDTFTASIDNLKQQIALRRKQYEHYRDQLLNLEGKEGVEMRKLGEVCDKISAGKNKVKNKTGQYPVFGSTGIIAYTNSYVYDTARILVARVGANAGFVYESYGKYDVTDNTLIVFLKDGICQKYVFHRLVWENINKYAKGGGQPLITASLLKDITIIVPSLPEQQRIVSILDTFEAAIANLEQQLVQREKQYEYYRNKLLTFE